MRVWFTIIHEVGPWGAEDNRKICHLVSSPDRSLTKLLPGPPASVSHPHLTYFPRFLGRRRSPPCTFCLLQCLSRARCSRGPLLVVAWDSPPCLASCYHAESAVCMYWPYGFGWLWLMLSCCLVLRVQAQCLFTRSLYDVKEEKEGCVCVHGV